MFKFGLKVVTLIFIFFYLLALNYKVSYYPIAKAPHFSVEIKGAVEQDKVILIKRGERLAEALKQVKLKENADLSSLSLQEVLYDKQIIAIPTKEKIEKISINTSSVSQLITIKGISKKIAQRIVENRKNGGPFLNLNDLRRVKGIGSKTFKKILPYICL